MKQVIQHEKHGEIVYEEGFFTGKRSITVGGVALENVSKKQFKWKDGRTVDVSGNYISGTRMVVDGETIYLTPKLRWYEIVLCILPFLLVLVWGNVPELCWIVPVVGGAIGGGVSGLFSIISLLVMKSVKPAWLKIIIGLAFLGATFGVCAGIGYAILAALI